MSTVAQGSSTTADVIKHAYGGHHVDVAPMATNSPTADGLTLVEMPASDDTMPIRRLLAAPGNGIGEWFEAGGSRGVRVSIFADGGARCLGTAIVTRAEESNFGRLAGLSEAQLAQTITISDVALDPAHAEETLPALLYLALRRGRIWERATVAAYVVESGSRGAQLLGLERLTRLVALGTRIPLGQRLDIAIYHAYRAASKEMQSFLRQQFVPEAEETLNRWLEVFFRNPWFRAVHDGTLTREQYVYTLANLHQFVRYTTRLIGRAVGLSDDRPLRNHFLNHLEGEINHELILEADLKSLGADVGYVVNSMVPHVLNQQFMVAQESAIGFYGDPVMLMAMPFVAEGYTGRMDEKFMSALERVAKSWGVDHPKHVTRFFSSHIAYDGGDDGHFEHIRAILPRYLTDDARLQRFLNFVHLAKNSCQLSYTAYVQDLVLFGAVSEAPAA